MDIQLNDNNDYSKPNSIENIKNNDICNDSAKISNCNEPKTQKVDYLDEFEKFLSEYTEQQRNCDNNTRTTHLNTSNESVIENIIEMGIDIAETVTNTDDWKPSQVDVNLNEVGYYNSGTPDMNENLFINSIQDSIIKEETSQSIKTEVDLVSLTTNKEIKIDDREQNLDNLSNIFASTNENKSIEIEVDIKNEITDEDIINSCFEADFSEAGSSRLNYTNFEIDTIELCENSSINDMNAIIDLTDSPNNSPMKLKTIHTEENNMSNIEIENTLEFGSNEAKLIYISDNESDCSFHSSDFELITEDEAKMDGLIINFRQQNGINEENDNNNDNIIEMCLPGPSNDYDYRENHRIPEGDEFFDMFHGFYAPANIPELIFLENKSVVPSQCMNVESDTLGFDVAALNKEVFDEKYQEEAKETAKKILSSYHDDERKRRRRPL